MEIWKGFGRGNITRVLQVIGEVLKGLVKGGLENDAIILKLG